MSATVKNKIELRHRLGSNYRTVPIGTEMIIVENLNRTKAVVAAIDGVEFILEKGQFEEVKTTRGFRPPIKRKKKTQEHKTG